MAHINIGDLFVPDHTIKYQRELIEVQIARLIDFLDELDPDPDVEPEEDVGADDLGEPQGVSWANPH